MILFPILLYLGLIFGPGLLEMLGDQSKLWSPFHPVTILLVALVTVILYGFLFKKSWVRSAMILLILLPMLGYLLAISYRVDGAATSSTTLVSSFELLLLVVSAGGFGGLMFGIREGKWYWPTTVDKNVTEVGFIKHLLIGAAGGIVIFIILPGEYNLVRDAATDGSNQIKYIQFIGLAFLGGFGGYALVERVYSDVTKTFVYEAVEGKNKEREAQEKQEAETLELLTQYLENKTMTATYFFENLEERIQKASLKTRLEVLYKVKESRQARWKELVGNPTEYRMKGVGPQISNEELEEGEGKYHTYVDKIVPVLSTLSKVEDANEHHRIFGQLGFSLKDKQIVDYQGSLNALNKAIEIRGDMQAGEMYEFNRAICRIMLKTGENQLIRDDLLTFAGNNEGKRILKNILMHQKNTKKLAKELNGLRKPSQNAAIIEWLSHADNTAYLEELKDKAEIPVG
ncbi:MAG: hypothetical protein AAFR61_03415 [Bacteroidota bacterium]